MADVLPMTGVEVLYPIVPLHQVDKILAQQDDKRWHRLVLTADKVRDVLRFRVTQAAFDNLITFLEAHAALTVDLTTAGVYPFGLNYSRNECRVISYNGHARELQRYFLLDVTFEHVVGIS